MFRPRVQLTRPAPPAAAIHPQHSSLKRPLDVDARDSAPKITRSHLFPPPPASRSPSPPTAADGEPALLGGASSGAPASPTACGAWAYDRTAHAGLCLDDDGNVHPPSIKVAHADWKAKHGRAFCSGADIALCLWPSDGESEDED